MSVLCKFVQHFARFSPRKACLKKWGDGQRFNIYPFTQYQIVYASKNKILNCYYGIVGCGGLRDSGYLFYFCFCFFFPGYALKCYQCGSFKSWDECKSKTKEVSCSGSEDRCGKADVKLDSSAAAVEAFAKGCTNSSNCGAKNCKSISPSMKITKCEIDCCEGDLCNGAQVPMASAIMLLACAILAFFR